MHGEAQTKVCFEYKNTSTKYIDKKVHLLQLWTNCHTFWSCVTETYKLTICDVAFFVIADSAQSFGSTYLHSLVLDVKQNQMLLPNVPKTSYTTYFPL